MKHLIYYDRTDFSRIVPVKNPLPNPVRVFSYYRLAMTSISIFTSFGRRDTSTVVRAGL